MTASTVTETPDGAPRSPGRARVLVISTIAFTLMFAVWLMFGVLGIPIRKEFGLTDVQLAWITAVAVLNGAIWRLPAGIAHRPLGRPEGHSPSCSPLTAIPAYLVSTVHQLPRLLLVLRLPRRLRRQLVQRRASPG